MIVSWHCFNHRLELAVSDAVKACTEVNTFKMFLDTVYALYSTSPKFNRELFSIASQLSIQLSRIGRILDTRWSASSCRTIQAIWQCYGALYRHFSGKSDEAGLDGKEKAKFSGMAKKLSNPGFIQHLALMYDALEELADLSLALQRSDINVLMAHKLISKQVAVFSA